MSHDVSAWFGLAFLIFSFAFVIWKILGSPGRKIQMAERAHIVTLTDGIITHHCPDGTQESVPFNSLRAVLIETNDLGPLATDVFWILVGEGSSGCYIPHGATGDAQLLEMLQTLPGFDSKKFIDAMSSTDCQTFTLWEREYPASSDTQTKGEQSGGERR